MSDPIIERLLWKEYRMQRGFWLSMAALAVVGQVLGLCLMPRHYFSGDVAWLFGLALGIPAFYALGCGATLFAAEREDGTLEQLRVLAAPGWKVWCSKLGFGLASTAALFGMLTLLAFSFEGIFAESRAPREMELKISVACVIAAIEFLAWGIFFSLLTKRPLNAACMGAVATLISIGVASWMGVETLHSNRVTGFSSPWTSANFVRLMLAVGVLLVDSWIALRWVLDRPDRRPVTEPEAVNRTELELLKERFLYAGVAAFFGAALIPVIVAIVGWPLLTVAQGFGDFRISSLMGAALIDGLAWGLLFALTIRHKLRAALFAAAVAFLNCQFITWVMAGLFWHGTPGAFGPWLFAISMRTVVAAGVLAIDVWLALRWRIAREYDRILSTTTSPERAVVIDSIALAPPAQLAENASTLRRLLWQERRQAWRTMLVFCFAAFGLLIFYRTTDPLRDEFSFAFILTVGAILSTLLGSCVFLAEQEGKRFRFFADHGVNARRVWLAKQAVWFPVALAGSYAFYFLNYYIETFRLKLAVTGSDLFAIGLLPLIAFGSGQIASILLSRGLIAGFSGLILTGVICSWLGLMRFLAVDLWWSVMPVPFVLILATWFRAPDWLLERSGWRPWLRLIVLLLVPLIGLPAAVATHRICEIPATGPGFSPAEFLRPVTRDEQETAESYRRAIALLTPLKPDESLQSKYVELTNAQEGWEHATPVERVWLESNRATLEATLRASQGSGCVFYDPHDRSFDSRLDDALATRQIGQLLMLEARRLESEGELDAALDCYLGAVRIAHHVATLGDGLQHEIGRVLEFMAMTRMPLWAAHADQTPERMRKAIRQLESLDSTAPSISDALKTQYILIRRAVTTDFESLLVDPRNDKAVAPTALMVRFMPWEVLRALRLLDYRTAEAIGYMSEVETALARDVPAPPWQPIGSAGYTPETRIDRWAATTVLPFPSRADYWGAQPVQEAMQRRALRIVLALKAWQLEHGELPQRLDQVVGEYLDRLPLDPWTAKPFTYVRSGFEAPVRFDWPRNVVIPPGQPFIYAASTNSGQLELIGTTPDGQPRYRATGLSGGVSYAASVFAFPIP